MDHETCSIAVKPSSQSMPRLSVVIPAFNAAAFLGETLQSVFDQSVSDCEIIVVDDGSTDGTADLLDSISDPRLRVIHQANGGVSAARNCGIVEARGDLLLFLDADDLLAPGAFMRFGAALKTHPEAVLAYGESPTFQSDNGVAEAKSAAPAGVFSGRPEGDALRRFLVNNPIGCPGAAVVRRGTAEKVGGFPVGITLGEDWVFWCRVASTGPVVWLGREAMVYRRVHGDNASLRLGADPENKAPAIAAVFNDEGVLARIPQREREGLRRRAESSAFAYAAQHWLKARKWRDARRGFQAALARRPFFLRNWILWGCASLRLLPRPIRRRLQ